MIVSMTREKFDSQFGIRQPIDYTTGSFSKETLIKVCNYFSQVTGISTALMPADGVTIEYNRETHMVEIKLSKIIKPYKVEGAADERSILLKGSKIIAISTGSGAIAYNELAIIAQTMNEALLHGLEDDSE
jgi:uncharacterized protein YycO